MTLLWADGYDSQQALTSGIYGPMGPDPITTNTTFATGRKGTGSCIQVTNDASGTGLRYEFGASHTTLIMGLALRLNTIFTLLTNVNVLAACRAQIPRLRLIVDDAGALKVLQSDQLDGSPGVTLGTTDTLIPVDDTNWTYLEMKVTAGISNDGSVEVRQDGVTTLTLSNVTTTDTVASFDAAGPAWFGVGGSYEDLGATCKFDDFYVCNDQGTVNNDFLGGVDVLSINPSGNGTDSDLVGSDADSVDNYALVDEVPPDSADYVGSATAGEKDTYAYSDIPTDGTVLGVVVRSIAAKSDTGAISGRNVAVHSGSTTTGADAPLTTGYKEAPGLVLEDVPGGTGWTPAQVNAAEFGWEVRA